MKKLLFLIVLGSVLLAACGASGGALAATVDGEQITVGDVEAFIFGDDSTVDKTTFASNLGFAIQFVVITDAAMEDFGISLTDEEVTERSDEIYNDFKTEGESLEDFLATREITEAFLTEVARQGIISDQIRAEFEPEAEDPTEEEIAEATKLALAQATNACVSHILVETEDEAMDALEQLDDGADFAELATELSTDTGSAANGGALGCATLDGYVAPFRDASLEATVGEVVPMPVESQFGFHVILVTDRVDPEEGTLLTEDEIIDGLIAQQVDTLYSEWFFEVVGAAEVTVEAEYGTWEPAPPSGPAVIPPTEE